MSAADSERGCGQRHFLILRWFRFFLLVLRLLTLLLLLHVTTVTTLSIDTAAMITLEGKMFVRWPLLVSLVL